MSYKHAIPTEVSVTDRFGDERVVHYRNGKWGVKRDATPILALNQAIGVLIGQRVKAFRLERGYTLEQLSQRAGLRGTPKQRIWEIENSIRQQGIRLGTLYALAMALDVEVTELLPPKVDVEKLVRSKRTPVLEVTA